MSEVTRDAFKRAFDDRATLASALRNLLGAVENYGEGGHSYRCEYRTAAMGWKPGEPPVIDCCCGLDELEEAFVAARAVLGAAA